MAGPSDALDELDRELWTFAGAEFVAHAWIDACRRRAGVAARDAVWLGADPIDAPRHDALLNLGDRAAAGFETLRAR